MNRLPSASLHVFSFSHCMVTLDVAIAQWEEKQRNHRNWGKRREYEKKRRI